MQNIINSSVLDKIIIGRVEPHIYAFSTNTVPDYLKVGDTYRPLEKRLNEWRKHFPNLEKQFTEKAKLDDETFYRDIAIHSYLERDLNKERLEKYSIKNLPYYSNEFFRDTSKKDITLAIEDIKHSYKKNSNKYQFYKFDSSRVPITHTYIRNENYTPRPNQQETIDKFKKALKKGRTNLLMYAVMRFGKSFTSMCCATEMKAKVVIIVTAKADVKEEWKRTVESHILFDEYEFADSNTLLESDKIIKKKINAGKRIVLFLTLQDLQGNDLKPKHIEVFSKKFDLLIIDETHFGARADEYGKVLRSEGLTRNEIKNETKAIDETLDELENFTKVLKPKVRLHLSGTPYRILMGSEFKDEDIIAFYQFTDITNDQEKWDKDNLSADETKEWDNPYYGFPQMIRFAFNPNDSSRKKMEELKKNGITYAFSALFRPKSITKDNINQNHKKFVNEKEILDLLEIIDGSKTDENLLSFLDYDKIKDGNMCRHIVCVLPFRASCDALEQLIKTHKRNFKNLNTYEIINIAGVDNDRLFSNTQSVKTKIKDCEAANKKTITLTVNRMLTGSTIEEWDTMLFLKDTASPQEYDQAIFRLQNQYVVKYVEPSGDVVKYNMKPQTLLVDFDPNRMFSMQEQKSQIYNVNTEANGNTRLEERIRRELEISPIIVLNKNKIVQVVPSDILDAVRQYSSDRSVLDEATTIPVDYSLLDIDVIRALIEKQSKIGSKQGLEIKPIAGDGDEVDIPLGEEENQKSKDKNAVDLEESLNENEEADFRKKFAMYYAKILFFAFFTDSKVKSLAEVIAELDSGSDNKRISKSLDLTKSILNLLHDRINPFVLSKLDYKIQNINTLTNDSDLEPIQRADNAMKKFIRLSVSEVVTTANVTKQVIDLLPSNYIKSKTKILDIASKQGEFVYAIYKKYGKDVANNFYSIPTSAIAYEFTRKVYKLLELNVSHIANNYSTFDLIKKNHLIKKDKIKIKNTYMKFDIIVGNPPYMEMDGGARASAKPIYNHFVNIAKQLNPRLITMIIPTRWYAGGKGLDEFRDAMLNDKHIAELHDFLNPEELFPGTNNRGGICFFLWDKSYNNQSKQTRVVTYQRGQRPFTIYRAIRTENSDIFIRHMIATEILKKVKNDVHFKSMEEHISSRKPFGLDGTIIRTKKFRQTKAKLKDPLKCFGKAKKIGYLERKEILTNTNWIDIYKVFAPYANNIGTELNDDNLNTFVGHPGSICTETYIAIGVTLNLNRTSAINLSKYFTTKFARFMLSLSKVSQHATAKTYRFVPAQNFNNSSDINWKKSVKEIDNQLYKKYKLTKEEIEFIEKMIKPMK